MPSLLDLPPELVSHILLLSALPSSRQPSPLDRSATSRQLRHLALVCRDWRAVAQRALLGGHGRWGERVRVYHDRQLARLADLVLEETEEGWKRKPEEGLTRLFRRLNVELWGDECPPELVALLQAAEGREEVVLSCVEGVRFDEIAGGAEHLRALSARQCSFSRLRAFSSPSLSSPSPSLPSPGAYAALRSLDLRLCTLRRHSLPLPSLSLSSSSPPTSPLPNLQHLLLHLGSEGASWSSLSFVRSFVRSVAGQLRAVSFDHLAFGAVFSPPPLGEGEGGEAEEGAEERVEFPQLRLYGLYWDAAYLSLVGSSLFFPSSASSSSSSASSSDASKPPTPLPPFLHLSLYPLPSALPILHGQLCDLFSAPSAACEGDKGEAPGWSWRGVEQVRIEGVLRDLDEFDAPFPADEEDLQDEEGEDGREEGGEDAPPPPGLRVGKVEHLLRLAAAAGVDCRIDAAPRASTRGGEAEEGDGEVEEGKEGEERATFQRGFGTSWWRFVREVC
ncbi:hypothetical protein JCM8097_001109 [Rhodosporidiobolus ruineniae]